MKTPEKILIVRTDRLGDVTLTLPLAGIIKKYFNDVKVYFLVKDYTAGLTSNHPYIDGTLIFRDQKGMKNFKKELRKLKSYSFDCSIIVHPTFRLALLMYLAGIKLRIGTGYRWYSFLFNRRIYEHRKTAEKHELEYNISLLGALGIDEKVSRANVEFSLQVDRKSKQTVLNFLNSRGFNDKLPTVIIHPGSGGSAADLPLAKFRKLIELLAQELKLNVILTGTKNENELCEKLIVTNKEINTAGEFELRELIALISISDILVANSTGPIHIAAALGKNVIGFYPKARECSPERWGPYTDKAFIFQPETDCKDCSCKECKEKNCMETIDIRSVTEAIKEIIYNANKI